MSSLFESWIQESLQLRREAQLLRSRRVVEAIDAVHVLIDGRSIVNFSSNNYLGLTHHPRLLNAMKSVDAAGAGAAALITGFTSLHQRAEKAIAQWKQTEAALLLPSGYQANVAAIQALAGVVESVGKRPIFFADKLVHASLVDALRQTGSPFRVFPHNRFDKLVRLLSELQHNDWPIVVVESIYSMDGDACDLRALCEIKKSHPFTLVLDEAHGSGVYGIAGAGYASELGLRDQVDVSIVTLSKGLGLFGGAIAASTAMCQAVLNFGRAYVYSTNVPPMMAAGVIEALAILRDEPDRIARVRQRAGSLRDQLKQAGIALLPGDSPIVPIVMGSEESALTLSSELLTAGYLVAAIRPPTVAKGTSRLRMTVSSEHSEAEIRGLVDAIMRQRVSD